MLTQELTLGEDVSLSECEYGEFVAIGGHSVLEHVVMDDYSYTGPYCYIQNARVGKFANIAPMVRIGATNHPIDTAAMHHFIYRRSLFGMGEDDQAFFEQRRCQMVELGHDCWIGHGAIVLPGIRIGNGAVVGAGSVVTKDVPDFMIVAGNPARPIRYRFEPDIIEQLQRIKWWDWSHEDLQGRIHDFWRPIEEFVELFKI